MSAADELEELLRVEDFHSWLQDVVEVIAATSGMTVSLEQHSNNDDDNKNKRKSKKSSTLAFPSALLTAAASGGHATIAELVTPVEQHVERFSDEYYTLLRKISSTVVDMTVVSSQHVWTIEGNGASAKLAIRKISNGGLVKNILTPGPHKTPCKLHFAFGKVFVGSAGGILMMFDPSATSKGPRKSQAHASAIQCMTSTFCSPLAAPERKSSSSTSSFVFTAGSNDGSIAQYSVDEGLKMQRQFLGHKSLVSAMLVVRGTLWSVDEGKTMRLWDLQSGKTLVLLKDIHSAPVVSLHAAKRDHQRFSDGVWSVSVDGTWKLWNVNQLLAACDRERGNSSRRSVLSFGKREVREFVMHSIHPVSSASSTATATSFTSTSDTARTSPATVSFSSSTFNFEKQSESMEGKMSIRYDSAFGVPLDPALIPSIDPSTKPSVAVSSKAKLVEVIAAMSKSDRNVQFFELDHLLPHVASPSEGLLIPDASSSLSTTIAPEDESTVAPSQDYMQAGLKRVSELVSAYEVRNKQRNAFRAGVAQQLRQEVVGLAYRRVLSEELKRAADRETHEVQGEMQQYKLLKEKLRSQARALRGFRTDYQQMEQSFSERKTQILGVVGDVDALLEKFKAEDEDLSKKKEEIQDELFALEEQKEKADEEIAQVSKEIRDVERVVEDYRGAQQETLQDFDRYQTSVDGLQRDIETLTQELERRRQESQEGKEQAANARQAASLERDQRHQKLLQEKKELEAQVASMEQKCDALEQNSLEMRREMEALTTQAATKHDSEFAIIKDLQMKQQLCQSRLRHEAKRHLSLSESLRELDIYKLHDMKVVLEALEEKALALVASVSSKQRPLLTQNAPDKLKIAAGKVKSQLFIIGEKLKSLCNDVRGEMDKWQPLVEKASVLTETRESNEGDSKSWRQRVQQQSQPTEQQQHMSARKRPEFALDLGAANLTMAERSARRSQRVWSATSRSPQGSNRYSRTNSARVLREHLKPDELTQIRNMEIMSKLKLSRRPTPDSGHRKE